MWEKIKIKLQMMWVQIKPELYKFLKTVVKLGIDILLPLAIEAVASAMAQKGLSGKERFEFAVGEVKKKAPDAAANGVLNAVRIAYTAETGAASKY